MDVISSMPNYQRLKYPNRFLGLIILLLSLFYMTFLEGDVIFSIKKNCRLLLNIRNVECEMFQSVVL